MPLNVIVWGIAKLLGVHLYDATLVIYSVNWDIIQRSTISVGCEYYLISYCYSKTYLVDVYNLVMGS